MDDVDAGDPTRRALLVALAGAALAAPVSAATGARPAKGAKKGKRPKPPLAAALVRVTATNGSRPDFGFAIDYDFSFIDLRVGPSSLQNTLSFLQPPLGTAEQMRVAFVAAVQRQVARLLGVAPGQVAVLLLRRRPRKQPPRFRTRRAPPAPPKGTPPWISTTTPRPRPAAACSPLWRAASPAEGARRARKGRKPPPLVSAFGTLVGVNATRTGSGVGGAAFSATVQVGAVDHRDDLTHSREYRVVLAADPLATTLARIAAQVRANLAADLGGGLEPDRVQVLLA